MKNFTYIDGDTGKEVSMKELEARHRERWYNFVFKCSVLLGIEGDMDKVKDMFWNDPSWFWTFDDGMTPEEAVAKYKSLQNPDHSDSI